MIELYCKDTHRRMVRTQKDTITVEIQANVCSTGELLKESCHMRTLRTQGNFQDNFRTYNNFQEYISQKTGVFSEYDWTTDYTWKLSEHQVLSGQDAAELSGCTSTVKMQQNCQDAAELSECSRTVRMHQNYQDAAELSGCSRTVRMQQNCVQQNCVQQNCVQQNCVQQNCVQQNCVQQNYVQQN